MKITVKSTAILCAFSALLITNEAKAQSKTTVELGSNKLQCDFYEWNYLAIKGVDVGFEGTGFQNSDFSFALDGSLVSNFHLGQGNIFTIKAGLAGRGDGDIDNGARSFSAEASGLYTISMNKKLKKTDFMIGHLDGMSEPMTYGRVRHNKYQLDQVSTGLRYNNALFRRHIPVAHIGLSRSMNTAFQPIVEDLILVDRVLSYGLKAHLLLSNAIGVEFRYFIYTRPMETPVKEGNQSDHMHNCLKTEYVIGIMSNYNTDTDPSRGPLFYAGITIGYTGLFSNLSERSN